MNYCEDNPNTCLNDGKCTSLIKDDGYYKCECPSGYRGRTCQILPPQMAAEAAADAAAISMASTVTLGALDQEDINSTPTPAVPASSSSETPLLPEKPLTAAPTNGVAQGDSIASQIALNAMMANIQKEMHTAGDDQAADLEDELDNEA